MLHYSWVTEQEQRCNVTKGSASIFDKIFCSKLRLPTGSSFNSRIHKLQRANDTKYWKKPTDSTGELIFDGMKFSVICERKESEIEW